MTKPKVPTWLLALLIAIPLWGVFILAIVTVTVQKSQQAEHCQVDCEVTELKEQPRD